MSRVRSILTAILAILGVLAVIGIGMWGSIKIAQNIPNIFSSLASVGAHSTSTPSVKGTEKITLSAPATTVKGGTTFPLSWTHEKKAVNGSYTFRYDCANGVFFVTPTPPSGAPETIYCNVPFNFLSNNNSIILTPVSQGSVPLPVTAYIDFTPNGATKPSITGSLSLTVENGGFNPATTTPSTPKPTTPSTGTPSGGTTYPVPGASDPNGYTDLRVTVLSAGYVDRATGAFYATPTPSRSQRVAVRFSIENAGTKTSPQFSFTASLPTNPATPFQSPAEQALRPGDRIEFVMGIEGASMASGNGVVTITVDPSNLIAESNKANNTTSYTITTTP